MFQFGKLAIQSTVSTLGTVAIAAQAMTNILENLNGIAAIGIGIGLMTVVGQCLGAGRKDEADESVFEDEDIVADSTDDDKSTSGEESQTVEIKIEAEDDKEESVN